MDTLLQDLRYAARALSKAYLGYYKVKPGVTGTPGPKDYENAGDYDHVLVPCTLRVGAEDAAVGVELLGYGIERTVPAGRPATIRFKASKPGNFPLLVTASHIDVARITVAGSAG